MSYVIPTNSNNNKVVFTYKLKGGSAKQSFAINVGRMAGLSDAILRIAEKKAREMEEEIKEREHTRMALLALNQCVDGE